MLPIFQFVRDFILYLGAGLLVLVALVAFANDSTGGGIVALFLAGCLGSLGLALDEWIKKTYTFYSGRVTKHVPK